MKISERAKQYASHVKENIDVCDYKENYEDEVKEAYISGAFDQQALSLEKAVEALYKIQDELGADMKNMEKAIDILTDVMVEEDNVSIQSKDLAFMLKALWDINTCDD